MPASWSPGPWARDAASHYRGEPVGVHLTLNAEMDCYRWRSITQAPSLHDGDGGLPRTVEDLWDHADLDETRRECRAQLERAVLWGFDVSHLSTHLGALQNRPEFFDVYLELAIDFGLPIRLAGGAAEASAGFPFRALAADEGVLTVDHHRMRRLADPAGPRTPGHGPGARGDRDRVGTGRRHPRVPGYRRRVGPAGRTS